MIIVYLYYISIFISNISRDMNDYIG